MSWERYRCETDCVTYPTACIDENLYRNMTVKLVEDGYLAAGYNMINVDGNEQRGRGEEG
jgi:alpha-N-acetylgalactosaminidase